MTTRADEYEHIKHTPYAVKQLINKVSKEIKHNGLSNIGKSLTGKTTTNAVKYLQKNTGKSIKGIINRALDSSILTTAQNRLKKLANYYK